MKHFELQNQDSLEEYQSTGRLYRHIQSGAEIYHMEAEDKENSFAFSFRTPPADDTGLPHILEHTVLCGSRNFPIKDPFITLYKGSMHTFLNAYTAPDRTVYPASSVVEKDFFNLMRIYGDAVFFPLLRKEAFMQEGHHMEKDAQGKPQRVGIVYNEMKGSYSSHESLLAEYSFRELFPGSPLNRDSGGDPEKIPALTYQQFKDFHQTYYHPSNCRIFLYGDIPVEKSLDFLHQHFLSAFNAKEIESAVQPIERWNQPLILQKPAPKGESDGCSHTLNWLMGPSWKGESRLAMQVLSQILIGTGGAPLQMAIQKSDLGEDLSPVSGLELDVCDMIYTLGIRGSGKEQGEAFRDMIFSELEKLVEEGIPSDQIEGALRLVEFREREIRGGIPFGLRLMGRVYRAWNYDRSPREGLEFETHLSKVRSKAFDKGYWEELIKEAFLQNPHYSLVTLYPDEAYESRLEKEEGRRNQQWLEEQSPEDLKQWEKDLEALRQFQQEEDDPAVLESIPFLTREEIPREVSHIPLYKEKNSKLTHYRQPQFTNGVFYANLGFNLADFTLEERLWLPFFSHSLTELGAGEWDYAQLAHRLSLNVGGLSSSLISATLLGKDRALSHLVLRVKMLEQQIPEALDLTEKVLFERNFQQETRLKELLLEMRNDIRTSLIPNGTGYALTRAAAPLSESAYMDEIWYGVTQYEHLQKAVEQWEKEGAEPLVKVLASLSRKIFTRLDWISLSAGEKELPFFEEQWNLRIAGWEILPVEALSLPIPSFPVEQSWESPTQVAFSAAVMKGPSLSSARYSTQLVISHLLKAGFLWEKVRMQGGAYGASAGASGLEEYFFFNSFRDPGGSRTFAAFREGLEYLKKHISTRDIDLALIGLVGKDLKPLSPAQKASMAVRRDIYGISDSLRQENRDRLLKLGPQDIREELDRMLEEWDREHRLVLMANKELIDSAHKDHPQLASNRNPLG